MQLITVADSFSYPLLPCGGASVLSCSAGAASKLKPPNLKAPFTKHTNACRGAGVQSDPVNSAAPVSTDVLFIHK